MLHPEENAAQQHRLALVPVLDGNLFERSDRAADAGVIIDDVETPELADRARDQRLDFSFGGYVGLLKDRAPRVLLAIANRSFAAFDVKVGDHDRRAFTRELDRGRASDSARRAGDYRHFALEPVHLKFSSRLRNYIATQTRVTRIVRNYQNASGCW